MTIDELAQMIERGFAETAKDMGDRFKEVDARFKDVNERLDVIDLHISSYASRWNEEFSKLHD